MSFSSFYPEVEGRSRRHTSTVFGQRPREHFFAALPALAGFGAPAAIGASVGLGALGGAGAAAATGGNIGAGAAGGAASGGLSSLLSAPGATGLGGVSQLGTVDKLVKILSQLGFSANFQGQNFNVGINARQGGGLTEALKALRAGRGGGAGGGGAAGGGGGQPQPGAGTPVRTLGAGGDGANFPSLLSVPPVGGVGQGQQDFDPAAPIGQLSRFFGTGRVPPRGAGGFVTR